MIVVAPRAALLVIAMLALVLCVPEGARAETSATAALHVDHGVRVASSCARASGGPAVALAAPRPELPFAVIIGAPGLANVGLPVNGEAVMLLADEPRQRSHDVLVSRAPPGA